MIIDRLENWRSVGEQTTWRTAFEYLTSLHAETAEGEIEIEGRMIFARVMSYATRPREALELEAHHDYYDIQMALRGSEGLAWNPEPGLNVTQAYDAARDVILLQMPEAPAGFITLAPGLFAILPPGDAHATGIQVGNASETIKKVVVKIHRSRVQQM